MKSEKEIRETLEKVDRITGFIGDCGTGEELNHERVAYGCAVSDFVSWIFDDRFSKRRLCRYAIAGKDGERH